MPLFLCLNTLLSPYVGHVALFMSIEKFVQPLARVTYFMNVSSLVYGAGASSVVGIEAKRLRTRENPIFLVTDKGVMKTGIPQKIKETIEKEGIQVDVYDGLASEPTIESARKLVERERESKHSLVVGVGGGTAMDSAKTAAIMATNTGDISDYLAFGEDRFKENSLPKILIPTTSGTGSEVSMFAIIIDKTGTKNWIAGPKLLADVAVVDALNIMSCPPRQTAASGMDALAHSMENVLNLGFTPFSDMVCLRSIKLIAENLRNAYYWGDNLEARYNMSIAAMLGGLAMGTTPAGANIGHCMVEALGPLYKVPHAVACGLVTPYVMDYNMPACIERLAMVAEAMSLDVHGLSKRDAATMAVQATRDLVKDIELPTSLKEIGFSKNEIPKTAKYLVEERQSYYLLQTYNPRRLTIENVTELLENMYEGQIAGD
jgi:alcohol dehydrogenase class IV